MSPVVLKTSSVTLDVMAEGKKKYKCHLSEPPCVGWHSRPRVQGRPSPGKEEQGPRTERLGLCPGLSNRIAGQFSFPAFSVWTPFPSNMSFSWDGSFPLTSQICGEHSLSSAHAVLHADLPPSASPPTATETSLY